MRYESIHDEKLRARARKHLRRADPVMARLIREYGDPWPGRPVSRFGTLVQMILDQQISTKAAESIRRRLYARLGGRPTAPRLLALSEDEFRACGVSRPKARYIRALAESVDRDELRLAGLHHRADDAVVEYLCRVKGIGPWTGEMFLIFTLGRPDVLSTGDLGLQNAARELYDLDERPKPADFVDLAERWRPYRSVASWYLWRSLRDSGW